ncbi:MAG: 4Fe-4S dicluster domain-containing protein [Firmicutes bacterium]|nr:4Fe-4S dicluster domain-containing protein [Bacillota bacterium]
MKKTKKLDTNVNIDDKLYLNRLKPDDRSHLSIKDADVCANNCLRKDCTLFCPAGVYKWSDNRIAINYEGCLECGACRIACPHENIEWQYPRGGFGIQFRLA